MNNSSNGFKSGGTSFFGTVPARLGAIEEVTVESAGLGGDAGATGGVNLKFVTRRGTNQYRGGMFEQYRTEKLNANSFANNARSIEKPELRRHDWGGNLGGPLVPRGSLREKLFFFVNYEQEHIPLTQTRNQTILTEEARQGIYRYQTAAGEQRTANVRSRAANGSSRRRIRRWPRCWRRRRRRGSGGDQQLDEPAHGDRRVDRAAETDQLLPDDALRLPDQ